MERKRRATILAVCVRSALDRSLGCLFSPCRDPGPSQGSMGDIGDEVEGFVHYHRVCDGGRPCMRSLR